MPPGNVQEAISCLKIIMGEDGTDLGRKKVKQLHDNSNYFRQKLIDMGFQVSYTREYLLKNWLLMRDLFQKGLWWERQSSYSDDVVLPR